MEGDCGLTLSNNIRPKFSHDYHCFTYATLTSCPYHLSLALSPNQIMFQCGIFNALPNLHLLWYVLFDYTIWLHDNRNNNNFKYLVREGVLTLYYSDVLSLCSLMTFLTKVKPYSYLLKMWSTSSIPYHCIFPMRTFKERPIHFHSEWKW